MKQKLQDIEQVKRRLLETRKQFVETVNMAKIEISALIDKLDKKYVSL